LRRETNDTVMTRVEVEYCVPCGMLNRAQDVSEAVLAQFGQDVTEVALVTGDDGVFVVRVDGEVVFDKTEDEYDVDAIVRAVRPHVGAAA
jgi:selenoprotein W-related protein